MPTSPRTSEAGAVAAAGTATAATGSRTIVVLHSLARPDGTTKYVDQMVQGAPADVQVHCFSWWRALRGHYDVLHVHWPELLLRGPTRRKRAAKRIAVLLLLLRLAVTRTPLVRTVHNPAPHEGSGRIERALLGRIDRRTDLFVHLSPATAAVGAAPVVQIPHGHYRDRFADLPVSAVVPGRVLHCGIIRPYKGVERLLALAPALSAQGVAVRVVGNPAAGMRPVVESAVAAAPNVSATLAFVPDDELVREVTAAELVVLPYREMHNSGVLLVALSLDRPALVPASPATDALAAEVGEAWVQRYEGELDEAVLLEALRAVRVPGRRPPRLDRRDWASVGLAHRDAYRAALVGGRTA